MLTPLNVNDYQRIRWACRRGMLELDVLLGKFFEDRYEKLTETEKQRFVGLLAEEDPEIFQWIMGHAKQAKEKYTDIIDKIRQHAKK